MRLENSGDRKKGAMNMDIFLLIVILPKFCSLLEEGGIAHNLRL